MAKFNVAIVEPWVRFPDAALYFVYDFNTNIGFEPTDIGPDIGRDHVISQRRHIWILSNDCEFGWVSAGWIFCFSFLLYDILWSMWYGMVCIAFLVCFAAHLSNQTYNNMVYYNTPTPITLLLFMLLELPVLLYHIPYHTIYYHTLKLCISRKARICDSFPNIFNATHVGNQPFETQTVSSVRHRSKATQVEIPPVICRI